MDVGDLFSVSCVDFVLGAKKDVQLNDKMHFTWILLFLNNRPVLVGAYGLFPLQECDDEFS